MAKYLAKYSYFLLIAPVFVLLILIKSNLDSNFAPERVLYAYLILYFIASIFPSKLLKFGYVTLVYLISIILTYIEWSYVSLYHERINVSTVFIVFETNGFESTEFISQNSNTMMIFVAIILIVYSALIIKITKTSFEQYSPVERYQALASDARVFLNYFISFFAKIYRKLNSNPFQKIGVHLVLIIGFVAIYFSGNHFKQHLVFLISDSFNQYKLELEKYQNFTFGKKEEQTQFNAKTNNPINENETHVLVIGESTNKTHLQLYGYYRNTTPNLSKMKNELVVFNDVISPHTHTIPCLEKMLTLGNYENPEKKYNGSIIDILKQAGYKTYWISNQIPVGMYETISTTIAKSSDVLIFTNSGSEKEQFSFDEKVFPYLEKALSDKVTKKFIIVHLLGTHVQYKNRYPLTFNEFKDSPNANYHSDEIYKTINYYDNSVLYNDFIVSTIIEKTKSFAKNQKTSVLYLSDHGEDVFETVDMAGHSEAISSKPMYLIPFIFWSNDKNQINEFQTYNNRKYMTDDLIFSIADMCNVQFNGNEPERSIFSPVFKERERKIKNGENFDAKF